MEAEGSVPTSFHPETLKEQPPEIVLNLYENVTELIAANGWYFLAVGLVLAFLWPKIRTVLEKWQDEREKRAEAAAHHKNPELYRTRQLAMEVARLRLQAEHDERAKRADEKAKEREAAKTRERLERNSGQNPGRRLNEAATNHSQDKERTTSRPEYNPLMGGGTSGGFRPSRRPCPGGGCG